MGAWFSSEEAPAVVTPTPSPDKISPPLSEHVQAKTLVQPEGAHFDRVARALPEARLL